MFLEYILKKLKYKNNKYKSNDINTADDNQGQITSVPLNIDDTEKLLKERFLYSGDFVVRRLIVSCPGGTKNQALIAYADGMVRQDLLSESIIKPLLHGRGELLIKPRQGTEKIDNINEYIIATGEVKKESDIEKGIAAILNGDCVLFLDKSANFSIISCKGYQTRSVEQPSYDVSMRGPRESFNENLRTNTSLLRRRVKNSNLVFENMVVGRKTSTNICITYINGLAEAKLIKEVKRRIKKIDVDMILESGYIEEYIEDSPLSVFATTGITERPDVLAAKLMEGRVGIMVDGSPFVLTAPFLLVEAFQNPEDYYTRTIYAGIVRIFRYLAFFLSIMVPGIYVALTSFHQELIPTSLLFSIAAASEGVPFGSFTEVMLFLLVFELLKEAGIHMPKNIGQTISIVGGLVMGEAAIQAGLIGAPVVIIIAFTAVSSFVVPTINNEVTLLRWIFLFAGGFFGGFGIAIALIGLTVHIAGLESFGYSFASPIMPCRPGDLKDTVIRAPLWLMRRRPYAMATQDKIRENTPVPPDNEKEKAKEDSEYV